MDELLAAIRDLEERFAARLSTRVVPSPYGTAYLDEAFRQRWMSNYLLATDGLETVDADELHAEADRILGGAGYGHRNVVVTSDTHGERLAPGFAERAYRVERSSLMVHRREPERRSAVHVEEVAFAAARPVIEETYRREPDLSPDVMTTFTDQHGKYERMLGTRFFVGRVGGEPAGVCELWMDGTDALVEHVDTLAEYRGRGVATAVVLKAIEAAHTAGASRVFIVADDDDWPKHLYARLGFDQIGRDWGLIRGPMDPA